VSAFCLCLIGGVCFLLCVLCGVCFVWCVVCCVHGVTPVVRKSFHLVYFTLNVLAREGVGVVGCCCMAEMGQAQLVDRAPIVQVVIYFLGPRSIARFGLSCASLCTAVNDAGVSGPPCVLVINRSNFYAEQRQMRHHLGDDFVDQYTQPVAGGCGDLNSGMQLWLYDLQLDVWKALTYVPTRRRCFACAEACGLIYIVGGYEDPWSESVGVVDVYDVRLNVWSTLQPLPTPREEAAVVIVDSCLYVLGGDVVDRSGQQYLPRLTATRPVATVEMLVLATGVWAVEMMMADARSCAASVAVGGIIYIFGGASRDNVALVTAEVFAPTLGMWRALCPMPLGRFGCVAVSVGLGIVVAGGLCHESMAPVLVFDIQLDQWARIGAMMSLSVFGAVDVDGCVYVFGGRNDHDDDMNAVGKFDTHTRVSQGFSRMPIRGSCMAFLLPGNYVDSTDPSVVDPDVPGWPSYCRGSMSDMQIPRSHICSGLPRRHPL
jgi:hypothetical protein